MENVKSIQSNELHQWLANAFVTGCQALGHGKTARNHHLVELYREELSSRGEVVPALGLFDNSSYKEQLYVIGVFNGPGST